MHFESPQGDVEFNFALDRCRTKRSWQDYFDNGQLHIVHADTGEMIGRKDSSCQ
jgi:hypothetical protein